ncbi:MAG: ABC transporter ATP-binding protein [Candidatus Helarchaeota archaeon]
MTEPLIEVNNLIKYYKIKVRRGKIRNLLLPAYKEFLALNNVSFEIKKDEIFGILGPNGAGKTTIVKLLCGLSYPTSGEIFIDKQDVVKNLYHIQTKVGTMFGNTMIYHRLTGYDNLKYYSRIYNILNYNERIEKLLRLVGLYKWKDQYVENYSLGMKSKLALARALIHDPEIIILDEPTLGLDVKNSLFIRKFLKNSGKTIIITTHNMEVANDICSRIALLSKGKIIAIDTPEKIKGKVLSNFIVEIESPEVEKIINLIENSSIIENFEQMNKKQIKIYFKFQENLQHILNILSNVKISSLKTITPSLEEAFLRLTSQKEQNQ